MSGERADAEAKDRAGVRTRAEEALVEFLARTRSGDGQGFEDFCAEHGDVEPELRGLYADFRRIEGLVGRSMATSVREELSRRYGEEIDPGITLDPVERPSSVFIERLGEHAPSGTRYQVNEEIARGGMGVILKVWDQDLRRTLAMKALLGGRGKVADGSRLPFEERALARFLEEAQITGQLGHPGILPVHEIGLDSDGRVFFTMPLVHGRDFKDVISLARQGKEGWNLTKALRVTIKVCEAVAYSHSRGVIHRDLKPANVMVGRFGETYVMDWGLARVLGRPDSHDIRIRSDDESGKVETDLADARHSAHASPLITRDGAVIGTPAFMSPEQADGRIEELDGRTDVYSIGAMMYQLLAKQMPYCPRGAFVGPRTVLKARLEGPPTPILKLNPEAPRELVNICEKAMATEPDERYGTPLEIAEDIENYLTSRPVSAHEATLGYQLRLAYQRNKTIVNTVAVAAVALVGVLWLFWSERQGARQRSFDVMSARALPAEVDELFPAVPALIPEMEVWVERVDALQRRAWRWNREAVRDDDSRRPEVASVLAALDRLEDLRPAVEQRLSSARDLRSPDFLDRERKWAEAAEAVAASPVYGGLRIEPIESLVPLGPDPESGLWEFWNLLSGDEPTRDPETGSIRPESGDGIVLVLLPGGSFLMGDPAGEQAEMTVAPFLASKYEVTQAQWLRIMGDNPSGYPAGLLVPEHISPRFPDERITDLHPVEFVGWYDAEEFGRRTQLEFLTEAQWEYACRAGTMSRWYWGDDPRDLEGRVNLADQSASAFGVGAEAWDDGYSMSAPIGSYPPNAFGLHDMIGNVREWCADWYEGDWVGGEVRKVMRGTSFAQSASWGASHARSVNYPTDVKFTRGVRLGRNPSPAAPVPR